MVHFLLRISPTKENTWKTMNFSRTRLYEKLNRNLSISTQIIHGQI